MLFRVARSASQRALLFDDELVVFNPETWDTHILNAAAALVFSELATAPRSAQEIESLLADALTADERENAADQARRLLDDLHTLGLIEPANDDAALDR